MAEEVDAEAIRTIYNLEVSTTTVTFDIVPRTLDDQVAWLRARSGAHVALVAVDDDGEVAGFGSLSPYRDRPAYNTSVEDSVYVRRDRQGLGVGTLLLERVGHDVERHRRGADLEVVDGPDRLAVTLLRHPHAHGGHRRRSAPPRCPAPDL